MCMKIMLIGNNIKKITFTDVIVIHFYFFNGMLKIIFDYSLENECKIIKI